MRLAMPIISIINFLASALSAPVKTGKSSLMRGVVPGQRNERLVPALPPLTPTMPLTIPEMEAPNCRREYSGEELEADEIYLEETRSELSRLRRTLTSFRSTIEEIKKRQFPQDIAKPSVQKLTIIALQAAGTNPPVDASSIAHTFIQYFHIAYPTLISSLSNSTDGDALLWFLAGGGASESAIDRFVKILNY